MFICQISLMGYCYSGNCYCGRCKGSSSHPYSVMLFLALALILLGLSPLVKFEVATEGFEKQLMTLVLLVTVLALLVLVRWLSPVDSCWNKCCKCGKCVSLKFSY